MKKTSPITHVKRKQTDNDITNTLDKEAKSKKTQRTQQKRKLNIVNTKFRQNKKQCK